MNFRALVLIADGVLDKTDECWDASGVSLVPGPVPVWLEFDMFLRPERLGLAGPSTLLGYAIFEREGDRVYANIKFNSAWHPRTLKRLTPAVGGVCRKVSYLPKGWRIDESSIRLFALSTSRNVDPRIPSLGEQGFDPQGW